MTSLRWYLLGLLGLFGAFVALEYYRPRPLDWRPTYLSKDKIPYGAYALVDQLPRLLGTDSVQIVRVATFNQLTGIAADPNDLDDEEGVGLLADSTQTTSSSDSTQAAPPDVSAPENAAAEAAGTDSATTETAAAEPDSASGASAEAEAADGEDTATVATSEEPAAEAPATTAAADSAAGAPAVAGAAIALLPARANYLFIGQDLHLGGADTRALLRYAAAGHDVFVAAENFGGFQAGGLADSLGVRSAALTLGLPRLDSIAARRDSVSLRFTNPRLGGAAYRLPAEGAAYRLRVEAGRRGATLATDAQGRAVLVRLDYGRGHFYLCSVPLAFTNYFVLQPRTTGFAAGALSYLPPRPAWWDEYQKTGPVGEQSLLRVLLDHDALRAAFYLLLLGGLLLVLVEARRRQRVIPTLKPLPNTTLLFTRTVAGLYQQGRGHTLMAEKKVSLFLDYLRTRFQEAAPDFGDEAFRERLSHKAGLPRARVDELLRLVNFARTAPQVTDRELLTLSRALSDFRREAKR